MSADSYLAQLRRWPPGRRVKLKGGGGGLLLYPVPVPTPLDAEPPNGESAPELRYALAVEIEKPEGFDVALVGADDLVLEPFDATVLRADLWHRVVEFDMPQLLGLPPGARHEGIISDVIFRGSPSDYAVGVRVEVDGNPSVNSHYLTVDFSQCRLRLRTR